jgi:hypothetical protein
MLETRAKNEKRAKPRRCVACGSEARIVRSGRRNDGSRWDLCRQCHEAWNESRELERLTVSFLKGRGALGER